MYKKHEMHYNDPKKWKLNHQVFTEHEALGGPPKVYHNTIAFMLESLWAK